MFSSSRLQSRFGCTFLTESTVISSILRSLLQKVFSDFYDRKSSLPHRHDPHSCVCAHAPHVLRSGVACLSTAHPASQSSHRSYMYFKSLVLLLSILTRPCLISLALPCHSATARIITRASLTCTCAHGRPGEESTRGSHARAE